jgi:hypothetical protein
MKPVIDYSKIKQPSTVSESEANWEGPPHVYFGRKLPNGKMEKEPVYVHRDYPRMMYYKMKDGSLDVREVQNEEEQDALGKGWVTSAAELGVITCPSFEQAVEMGLVDTASPTFQQPTQEAIRGSATPDDDEEQELEAAKRAHASNVRAARAAKKVEEEEPEVLGRRKRK